MKLDYKYVLGLCILCLVLGMTICQREPETHTVTVGGLSFTEYLRDMLKPRFPHFIFIKGKDGKQDTFTVYEDTPIGEIPIQMKSGTFNIPLVVDGKPDSTWWGYFFFSYQGIGDSIKIEIPQKDITLKTDSDKKFLTFYKFIKATVDIPITSDSLNNQKELFVGLGGGMNVKERLSVDGAIGMNNRFDIVGKVELRVNF